MHRHRGCASVWFFGVWWKQARYVSAPMRPSIHGTSGSLAMMSLHCSVGLADEHSYGLGPCRTTWGDTQFPDPDFVPSGAPLPTS